MNYRKHPYFFILLSAALLSFWNFRAQSQNDFSKEFLLGIDNDYFAPFATIDRNYSYGFNLTMRWKPNKERFFGKIFPNKQGYYKNFGLFLKAFTPNYLDDGTPDDTRIERPFAGWSYAQFSNTYGFEKSFFRFGIETGVLGEASQAGAIQNWFHRNTGNTILDWDNQIPNQLGVNLTSTYAHELLVTKVFDSYGSADASLGNIFTYVLPKLNFRVGWFNPISESVATQNGLLSSNQKAEAFFEYGLGMKFSAYNATVQGNLFKEDAFDRFDEINNTIFRMHFGFNHSYRQFALAFKYHYSTGEFEQTRIHRYGAFRLLYRF